MDGLSAAARGVTRIGYDAPGGVPSSKKSKSWRNARFFDKQQPQSCRSLHAWQCARDTSGAYSDSKRSVFCQVLVDDYNDVANDAIAAQGRDILSEADGEQSFFTRLALAWAILFPSKRNKTSSNADIAKQRLKMILISDRCSVNDEAKRRIVDNIVGSLSDFVEIESEDKVQLTVSSDPALGTVYSVSVPVRRVKPEYQEYSCELQNVSLAEEFADEFRTLDIKLEYPNAVDTQQRS